MPTAWRLTSLALALLVPACAGTLPEPIYANQVEGYFPADGAVAIETEGDAPEDGVADDGATEDVVAANDTAASDAAASDAASERFDLHEAAALCAARLNGHRESAEVVSIIQAIISGVGGAASGVGGVFAAIDFGDPDLTTAMGVVASVGAGITLIGNLIIGFAANPLEELRLRSQAERSWQLAVELQFAHGDPSAVHENLMRCSNDEAPPVRVVGEGEPFSR